MARTIRHANATIVTTANTRGIHESPTTTAPYPGIRKTTANQANTPPRVNRQFSTALQLAMLSHRYQIGPAPRQVAGVSIRQTLPSGVFKGVHMRGICALSDECETGAAHGKDPVRTRPGTHPAEHGNRQRGVAR